MIEPNIYTPEQVALRLEKSWINEKSRPPLRARLEELESIRREISRKDVKNIDFLPSSSTPSLWDPITEESTGVAWMDFLGAKPAPSILKRYCEIDSPHEIFRVIRTIARTSAVVERRRKLEAWKLGDRIVVQGLMEWYRSLSSRRLALVVIVDERVDVDTHRLVKEFAFLQLLGRWKISVKPVFLSPSVMVSGKSRRLMVTKLYGCSLQEFLEYRRTLPLLDAMQIGRLMLKLVFKVHALGIAHGGIHAGAFVFVEGSDMKKGLRIRGFENAILDERGLSRIALSDLRMVFSIFTDMNMNILALARGEKVRVLSGPLQDAVGPHIVCINIELSNKLFVGDVDMKKAMKCIDDAIQVLSRNL